LLHALATTSEQTFLASQQLLGYAMAGQSFPYKYATLYQPSPHLHNVNLDLVPN